MAGRKRTIGELEDELKHRDRRIEELRQEIDEQRDLVRRMEAHILDASNVIERWKETFDMTQTESGWTWAPFWDERSKLIDDYNDLVRDWNKHLPIINGSSQPVGRPLAASEEQCATVRKLRKAGKSLRWIAGQPPFRPLTHSGGVLVGEQIRLTASGAAKLAIREKV